MSLTVDRPFLAEAELPLLSLATQIGDVLNLACFLVEGLLDQKRVVLNALAGGSSANAPPRAGMTTQSPRTTAFICLQHLWQGWNQSHFSQRRGLRTRRIAGDRISTNE